MSMSYTYPEWIVPDGVDKDELLSEVEQALDSYEARGAVGFLCHLAEDSGWVNLSKTLSATLVGDEERSLEGHIERINGMCPYNLGRQSNTVVRAERRVEWLKQLQEKLP